MSDFKRIELTKGLYVLVDAEDYDYLNQWHWSFDGRYATRRFYKNNVGTKVYMHKLLIGGGKKDVDHINRNKLDNRRSNLRVCDRGLNTINRDAISTNKSGFTGVIWHKKAQKWMAHMGFKGELIYLGLFEDKLDAIKARKKAELNYWGVV